MNLDKIIEKEYSNCTQIIIKKNNEILYENCFNGCNHDHKIHVYSVTKSIVSLLIGIAIDKGYLKSVDQKINEFYPCKKDYTIKDILTMSIHYKYLIPPYIKYFTSHSFVDFSLDMLNKSKAGDFKYEPMFGLDVLCGILVKVTKMSVLEFANLYLFEPLDIQIKNHITFKDKEDQMKFNNSIEYNGWVCDPSGIHTAGWGLTLSATDLIKIGEMLLNEGEYNQNQIISKQWIQECTSTQNIWKKRNLKYGYLFWVSVDGFSMMGDGGNILYVNKEQRLIVSMTGLFDQKSKDRIDTIKKYIEM